MIDDDDDDDDNEYIHNRILAGIMMDVKLNHSKWNDPISLYHLSFTGMGVCCDCQHVCS